MNPHELENQVVVVTGGSRGIGRAIIVGALARGARVAFCAREIDAETQQFVAEANARGKLCALAVRADIAREEDVARLFEETRRAFKRVDALVNNAGIVRDHLLVSFPAQTWDEIIATNLTGAFLCAQRALAQFQAQGGGGCIVSIGSVAQNGLEGSTGYAMAKGGLAGLTRAIATQYDAAGVRANLIVTGYVGTEMTQSLPDEIRRALMRVTPSKRMAALDEIANVALGLISRRIQIANGEALHVSGGLLDPPSLPRASD